MKVVKRSTDSFLLEGISDTAVLLIHGFTGSPSELRPMGDFLNEAGYTVYAPLLAGHGTTPEVMNQTTHLDWYASALEAYHRVRKMDIEHMIVIGLSMGGLLTLKLAVEQKADAIVSLCTPIYLTDKRAKFSHVAKYLIPYLPRRGRKQEHIEENIVPLDRTPVGCVSSLLKLLKSVKKDLRLMNSPTLIIQAGMDETVDPRSADYIYEQIGSETKQLISYPSSTHVITLDHDREKVFQEILEFIREQESILKSNKKAHISK
jgi:carboxylesterase